MSRNHYFAGILHSIYNLLTAHIPLMLVTAIIIVYSSVNNTATPEKHPQLPATHVNDTRQHNVDNSPHHRLQPAEKSVCIDVRPRVKFLCNISSFVCVGECCLCWWKNLCQWWQVPAETSEAPGSWCSSSCAATWPREKRKICSFHWFIPKYANN